MSVKMLQSEVGMVGDPSPNAELFDKVCTLLNTFEHNHDNETAYDNFFFLAGVKMGQKVVIKCEADKKGIVVGGLMCGCTEDIATSICAWLIENPEFIPMFSIATNEAINVVEKGGYNDNDI